MFSYAGVVEYECLSTWPAEVTEVLEREFQTLQAYEERRAEVDAICQADVMARINVPENAHRGRRDKIVDDVSNILSRHKLLGFHCTRLTEGEVAGIKEHGLLPLDDSLLQRRVERVAAEGLLDLKNKERLLSVHQANESGRRGIVHFINCRSILSDEDSVYRLFRSWGGEALYNSHESRKGTGPILRRIGNPAIIVTAIPISRLRTFNGMGEQFVWKHLSDRGVPIDQGVGIQTDTDEAVLPSLILDIITYSDECFEALTGCSSWEESIA